MESILLLSLPLLNTVGLFLEEAEEKDYTGIPSFLLLSYILAPFQAYASVKGFLEHKEGPWFRTPKTGRITDTYRRGSVYRWLAGIIGTKEIPVAITKLAWHYRITDSLMGTFRKSNKRVISRVITSVFLSISILVVNLVPYLPFVIDSQAVEPSLRTIDNMPLLSQTRESQLLEQIDIDSRNKDQSRVNDSYVDFTSPKSIQKTILDPINQTVW